jgi:hypothetical protein
MSAILNDETKKVLTAPLFSVGGYFTNVNFADYGAGLDVGNGFFKRGH